MSKSKASKPIDLHGRNALVTGAARGIGAATAKALAREGANVIIADIIDADETVESIRAIGRKSMAIKANVSDAVQVKKMAKDAIEAFEHIDILVNNAAVCHNHTLVDTTEETWDRVISIGLKGTFLCIQAFYPHMKERGYGKIVNVSSISGVVGGLIRKPKVESKKIIPRSGVAYAAAKGGILALTRWVAKEVAKDGIYVNAIAPGATETEMTQNRNLGEGEIPLGRKGQPADTAEAILFLASCASDYITGQLLIVDGGQVMAR